MFYAIGSLLCLFALAFAVSVIAVNLRHYHQQMVAALRTLSLDSVHAQPRAAQAPSGLAFRKDSARPALRPAV
jgi:hypothetical protein